MKPFGPFLWELHLNAEGRWGATCRITLPEADLEARVNGNSMSGAEVDAWRGMALLLAQKLAAQTPQPPAPQHKDCPRDQEEARPQPAYQGPYD